MDQPARLLHYVSEKPWAYTKEWDDFKLWNRTMQEVVDAHPGVYAILTPRVTRVVRKPVPASAAKPISWSALAAKHSTASATTTPDASSQVTHTETTSAPPEADTRPGQAEE